MVAVIAFAALAIALIGGISYFALLPPAATTPPVGDSGTATRTPAPAADDNTKPAAPRQPSSSDELLRYSQAMQPLIAASRVEMNSLILDLREFLKNVNRTSKPADSRRVIDAFREKMKAREEKLARLSGAMRALAPPTELAAEHQRLTLGMTKYLGAVQGYISGLSAYSFNQIKASQENLAAADVEIKAAAEAFHQAVTRILSAQQ